MPTAPPSQKAPPCKQFGVADHCVGRAERLALRSLEADAGSGVAEPRAERDLATEALPRTEGVALRGATDCVRERVVIVDADTEPEKEKGAESESAAEGVPPVKGLRVPTKEPVVRGEAEAEPPTNGLAVATMLPVAVARADAECVPRTLLAVGKGAQEASSARLAGVAVPRGERVAPGERLRRAESEPEGGDVEDGEGRGELDALGVRESWAEAEGDCDMVFSRVADLLAGGERESVASAEVVPSTGGFHVGNGAQEAPAGMLAAVAVGARPVRDSEGLRESSGERVSRVEAEGDTVLRDDRDTESEPEGEGDVEGLGVLVIERNEDGESVLLGDALPPSTWAVG